jgi:hypothetical protein
MKEKGASAAGKSKNHSKWTYKGTVTKSALP